MGHNRWPLQGRQAFLIRCTCRRLPPFKVRWEAKGWQAALKRPGPEKTGAQHNIMTHNVDDAAHAKHVILRAQLGHGGMWTIYIKRGRENQFLERTVIEVDIMHGFDEFGKDNLAFFSRSLGQ